MNIYFAGRRVAGIDALALFGRVLTDHLAAPETFDGAHSERELHALDLSLLGAAEVVVADVTQPSTGTGYMIARAIAAGLPVLALAECGAPRSAMIAGSPDLRFVAYDDDADFARACAAFFIAHRLRTAAPMIYLAGPPGCGKGTLGARLAQHTGLPHISTGAILRALPDTHAHAATIRADMAAGRLVSAAIMRDIVAERLAAQDVTTLGAILDGYPPSHADLDNLVALGIRPSLVLDLACSDATSIARQTARAARATDTAAKARDRLAHFHATQPAFDGAVVVRLDAEGTPAAVEAAALAAVRDILGGTHQARSYFVAPGTRPPRRARVHFHIDGPDHAHVRRAAHLLHVAHPAVQGDVKIYPIRGLALGPQHATPIYRSLGNFHPIAFPSRTEAFVTGRLGDGDPAAMASVLATTQQVGGMCELEEYVGEWTLEADGQVRIDAAFEALPADAIGHYGAYHHALAADIPKWELHHGFDLPKTSATPPIALPDLVARCTAAGLDNGGWFLFANDRHWAYRSNEFRDATLSQEAAYERLVAQARALHAIAGVPIGFSLEIVHGIWNFPDPTR